MPRSLLQTFFFFFLLAIYPALFGASSIVALTVITNHVIPEAVEHSPCTNHKDGQTYGYGCRYAA